MLKWFGNVHVLGHNVKVTFTVQLTPAIFSGEPLRHQKYLRRRRFPPNRLLLILQPQTCTVALFYAKTSSASVAAWCLEYVPDRFRNLLTAPGDREI